MRKSWRSSFSAALKVLAIALAPAFLAAPALAQTPDLMIQNDGPTTVTADTDIVYTITLTNFGDGGSDGPDSVPNAMMSDPIPAGLTFVSVDAPAGWSCPYGGGVVTCTTFSMDEGSATFTIIAHVDAGNAPGTYFTNIATATSCCDPNEENNASTSVAYIPAPSADVGVTISAPENAIAGADIDYTITLTNGGPDGAENMHMLFSLPAPLTGHISDVSVSQPADCSISGGGVAFDCYTISGPFSAGGTFTVTVTASIPSFLPEGTFLSAHPVVTTSTLDVNPENDSSSAGTTLQGDANVGVSITGPLTGDLNDEVSFAIHVQNDGPSGATNAVVESTLPAGMIFSSIDAPSGWGCATPAVGSSGTITCSRSEFFSGASEDIQIGAQLVAAGSLAIVGDINSADEDLDTGDNSASASIAVNGGTPAVTLSSSANPVVVGEMVTFTATVPGVGATPTGTIIFSDGPTNLATVPLSGGTATLSISSLAIGKHNIVATYGGDAFYEGSISATLVQKISPPGSMSLDIGFGSSGFVSAGETIELRYTLTNIGSIPVNDISVADTKVTGITCPRTSIGVGAVMTCTGSYVVTDADVTAGSIAFEATASGNGGEMVTSTVSIAGAAGVVSDVFEEMTRGFVETRQKLIAAGIETPSLNDRKDRSSVSLSENDGEAVLNFVATSADLWDRGPGAALASGADGSPFTFWIDGTLTLHTRSDAHGSFGLVGLGADYLVNEDLLAGVALYVDFMRDIADTGEITGNGALIGPYVSVAIAEGMTLDAGLYYGRSWNDATANVLGTDFSGSFETERFIADIELEGEWLLDQLTIRPSGSLYLANETAESYTVTNGSGGSVDVDGFTAATVRLGTGLAVERTFALESGLDLTPELAGRIGLGGSGEDFEIDGLFGRLSGGLTLAGDAWALRGVLDLGADATGLATASIRAQLNGSF